MSPWARRARPVVVWGLLGISLGSAVQGEMWLAVCAAWIACAWAWGFG